MILRGIWVNRKPASYLNTWRRITVIIDKLFYKFVNLFKPKVILCVGNQADRYARHLSSFNVQILNFSDVEGDKNKALEFSRIHSSSLKIDFVLFTSPVILSDSVLKDAEILFLSSIALKENQDFWEMLKSNPRFNVQLDCFDYGIAFYKPKQHQEYFKLRF